LKLERYDEAAASFRSSLAAEPNSFAPRLHLGMALLNQKKFAEAATEFTGAADLDKAAVLPQYYVGVAKYEAGDVDNALSAFEKAKELNGDKPYPLLHKYLASLYLRKAQWASAIAALEKYLVQSPDASDAEKIRSTLAEARAKIK
jgi:tetratricopeptide (TPR) repeat protein